MRAAVSGCRERFLEDFCGKFGCFKTRDYLCSAEVCVISGFHTNDSALIEEFFLCQNLNYSLIINTFSSHEKLFSRQSGSFGAVRYGGCHGVVVYDEGR